MQIFLSHATSDRDIVDEVKSAVGTRAMVYCTEDDEQAGVNVHHKIQKEIDRSDVVIALLTKQGAQSLYVHDEIGWALKAKKLVIPVVAAGVAHQDLTMLEGRQYIRIDDDPNSDWVQRLSTRIEALVQQEQLQKIALGVLLVVVGVLIAAES